MRQTFENAPSRTFVNKGKKKRKDRGPKARTPDAKGGRKPPYKPLVGL
jgi:hypothetical protein